MRIALCPGIQENTKPAEIALYIVKAVSTGSFAKMADNRVAPVTHWLERPRKGLSSFRAILLLSLS